MPNAVLILIFAAIALLALIDVGLGQVLPDHFAQQDAPARIGFREFATRPLPIFLFGIGAAMLPGSLPTGAGLLALAAVLALAKGKPSRSCKEGA